MKTLYGSCPAEGLLWKCANDGRDIMIYPWEEDKGSGEGLKGSWTIIENCGDYEKHGLPINDILQATIDLQVTDVTVYNELGTTVPASVSTVPFRRFIKMLFEGVPVARCTFPDERGLLYVKELSREQRIRSFLNSAVPYIWVRAKVIAQQARFKDDNNENRYRNAIKSIKNYSTKNTNDPVNHPSHYQLHGGMEVIDIIEAVTWDLPGNEGNSIGNAIKYICRYRNKYKPVQDLEKAKWYLNRVIEDYKKRKEGD